MKIIISGAGDLGFHLAELLSEEAKDIYLIDHDAERIEYVQSHLDVLCLKGHTPNLDVLEEANVDQADLVLAVTSNQEANLLTCIISKKLGAKKTIARVSSQRSLTESEKALYIEAGVDSIISPKELAAKEIKRLIEESTLSDSFTFSQGQLHLIGLTVQPNTQVIGKNVVQVAHMIPDIKFLPIAIKRGDEVLIPKGRTMFEENDQVYLITAPEAVQQIKALSGNADLQIRNIMILGGGIVGSLSAEMLQNKYHVKLIEKSKKKSLNLAERLSNTLVVNADGRDVGDLEEENLNEMDAFIAVTGDSETNIISCLIAKNHGIARTIALVDNTEYIDLSQNIGVDTLINRKLIAANNIFRHVREGEISAITHLHGIRSEIIEFVVKAKTRITKDILRNLNFPANAAIGGVIRDGKGMIPLGGFHFQEDDHVIVFALPEAISEVERFFK